MSHFFLIIDGRPLDTHSWYMLRNKGAKILVISDRRAVCSSVMCSDDRKNEHIIHRDLVKHGSQGWLSHESLALDSALVQKISKHHFFQDIKNSFHRVTQICLKPHQNFFQIFFSTNTAARGVQSFCILEGATHPLI